MPLMNTVVSAPVNASQAGANTIVAAVADRVIVVLAYKIICAGDVVITWESGGGSILDGPCSFSANGGESSPDSERGHFWTGRGEALILNLSGAVQVGGHLKYALI